MSIAGRWRITEMDVWDQDAFDLLGPAFFSFDGKRSGSFRFIAVEGWMDAVTGSETDGRSWSSPGTATTSAILRAAEDSSDLKRTGR